MHHRPVQDPLPHSHPIEEDSFVSFQKSVYFWVGEDVREWINIPHELQPCAAMQ